LSDQLGDPFKVVERVIGDVDACQGASVHCRNEKTVEKSAQPVIDVCSAL
jgi:hypothetical protein